MLSHTVPKKLLEQFAYEDSRAKSKRLWQYQKGLPPWGRASPKTATAWDGHFSDPDNAAKEAELELRLKREFEDPVNDFIQEIGRPSFSFEPERVRLLAGYMRMLFARSRARKEASAEIAKDKAGAIRELLRNDEEMTALA